MVDNHRESNRDSGGELPMDAQVTSSFPAGAVPSADPVPDDSEANSDADSWVAQWGSLFEDDPEPAAGPSTREMPVYQAEQPPVSEVSQRSGVLPGHLGPTAPGQETQGDQSSRDKPQRSDGDAAEIAAWQKSQERTKRRAKLRANQRKARDMQRDRPAGGDIRAGDPISYRPSLGAGPNRRTALITGALVLVGAVALFGYLLTGFGQGSDGDDDSDSVAGRSIALPGEDLPVGADLGQLGIQDLALSTVQLVGLNDAFEPECAGSGVIIGSNGLILTNAHVVTSEGSCQFTSVGVAVTRDSTTAARLQYRAVVLAVDPILDLAVIRIDGMLDPDDGELPESFPAAPLGDSDSVRLGDGVRILGYPAIGGETITLTTGSVSGFTAQAGIGERALIKTDATISAGNSGGMAVDASGRVIGIPTKARASETGPAIDCRPLSDTNADGAVDGDDNCVSVGGFLNGVRPINLANPILRQAAIADPIGDVVLPDGPQSDIDFDGVIVENPRFSLGQRDDRPVEIVTTAEAGVSSLCVFFDWAGIPEGARWDGAWFIDGQPEPELGLPTEPWSAGESGSDFWVCADDDSDAGLPAGTYEVGFFLEGEVLFAEGIVVTEEPVDVVSVTWSNDTGIELCGLAVNPLSDSGRVGLNELEQGQSIPPGDSWQVELPLGRYVVEAYNCNGEAVADNFDGLKVEEPVTFLIGIGPSN